MIFAHRLKTVEHRGCRYVFRLSLCHSKSTIIISYCAKIEQKATNFKEMNQTGEMVQHCLIFRTDSALGLHNLFPFFPISYPSGFTGSDPSLQLHYLF